MSKFFIDNSKISGDEIYITGDDVKHIKNVLRLKAGDNIIVCNGCGMDYYVRLDKFESDRVTATVLKAESCKSEPPIEVTLFQGIPKSDKMDYIIQKCVELGVSRIIPVITERTVVKFENQKDMEKKTARWQKIVIEAAKQCDRGVIPQVALPVKFDQALEIAKNSDLSIIPYEKETQNGLRKEIKPGVKSISIFIGPEGGFSEAEIQAASKKAIKPVTLGPRILRTETAGIAVMSILMYELGDVGK